ncbi:hypothetical protein LCGC14_2194830 [marine sediment metagenome]|uniref:DUF551 domain-containing protein n=1 Tax=marine sediment metagenome TaxID=412755 RepID=A0A0F9E5J9_9ZZZZ
MNWIETKFEKPENDRWIMVAHLHRYSNSPWHYTISMAKYGYSRTYGKCVWVDYHNESRYEPDFWINVPDPPEIKYKNKSNDCKHKWEEQSNDTRFCDQCGTTQKAIITKTWK